MPKKAKPKAKSVFHDLYYPGQAAEKEIRSSLMIGLSQWLAHSDMTQAAAAKVLGVTQTKVSDIKRGAISRSSRRRLDFFA
jgi:predicted XRE-type DNA-binding protein